MLRPLHILMCLAMVQTALAQSDTLAPSRNGRWSITVAGNLFPFRVPDLRIEQDRRFFAPSVALRWEKSRRTSWRITHSRSFVSSEAYEATDLNSVVYDVTRDLWANDTRIELLLRNLRTTREGRGLYFVTGWTFRSIWMRYHLDPDPPTDPSWDIYPYVTFFDANDVRSYFDFFTLWAIGPGYDRRLGPVDLFVEPSAEVYFSYLRGGGGDPISVRPRISLGVAYRFGRSLPPMQ